MENKEFPEEELLREDPSFEEDALPEEALRVAELLLSLSFQKPEKYRLKGEHYDVSPIDSDEKQRYHLRAERTLFRSNFKNMLPTALRFFVFAVASVYGCHSS